MLSQHPKKHYAGARSLAPDPLVDSGNPSHRYQARSTAHLDRPCSHMVVMAASSPGQHDYVQRIKNFAAFLGRSPDTASFEDVRRYQLHLAESGVGVRTINQAVSIMRFFFKVTLGRHEIVEHTHFIHEPRKLPVVLSVEEVARL